MEMFNESAHICTLNLRTPPFPSKYRYHQTLIVIPYVLGDISISILLCVGMSGVLWSFPGCGTVCQSYTGTTSRHQSDRGFRSKATHLIRLGSSLGLFRLPNLIQDNNSPFSPLSHNWIHTEGVLIGTRRLENPRGLCDSVTL